MMSLRQASIVLLVLAAGMVILGAGGFSAMEADRPVSVTVVDDERANLKVNAESVDSNDTVRVTAVNRFPVPVEIIKLDTGDKSFKLDNLVIETGKKENFTLTIEKDKITVYVEGKGVSAGVTTAL